MIYEWKCRKCGKIVEVMRPVEQWNVPPEDESHDWFRYISKAPTTMFQHLRHSGIFADDNGNFAPRKT